MATSFVQGTFTGSSSQINVTFGYLDKTHVYVYLNGVLKTVGVDYVWNSDAQIQILGGNPAAGTVFLAQRRTPNELMTTYAPGNLDSTDLNFSFLQAIYIANEAQDAISQKWNTLEGVTGRTIQAVGTTSGNILVYDASGNLIDSGTNISSLASVPANAALALQYRNEAQGFRNEASNYSVSASGYATQSLGYRDQSQGYSLVAQDYATSMSLINGTDYSAKYWANQAYLAGGVPIGTIIDVYGNGTTTPVGYLKVIPGLEITNAYPEFRTWALANGWATNGAGNPVFPSTDDALFKRQWRAGQALRDAGRVFGTVQLDRFQGHIHPSGIVGNSGAIYQVTSRQEGQTANTGNPISDGTNGTPRTGPETNPANITVTWFIKAYSAPLDAATVAAAQVLADLADVRARVSSKLAARYGAVAVNPNTAAVLFTGIPAEVNRVTIKWADMNVSASALPVVRIGSGSIQVGTYVTSGTGTSSTGIGNAGESSGIALGHAATSGTFGGLLSIERLTAGSNIWVYRGQTYYAGAASGAHFLCAGKVTLLAGELDRVQMTTLAGTATISGTIAVTWEF